MVPFHYVIWVSVLPKMPFMHFSVHFTMCIFQLYHFKVLRSCFTFLQVGFSVTQNAASTLRHFCYWQNIQNIESDYNPYHHDTAVLITRWVTWIKDGRRTLSEVTPLFNSMHFMTLPCTHRQIWKLLYGKQNEKEADPSSESSQKWRKSIRIPCWLVQ